MAGDATRRAEEIFGDALERPAAERAAFVAAACGGDAALRAEVESLLAADQAAGQFMAALTRATPADAGADPGAGAGGGGATPSEVGPVHAAVPERIGRYRITRVIGSGGMGVVYEAEQEQPRRTVAVKVMRRGLVSRTAMRRFAQEAEVLARLRHPGIAQVFEAGTHDDGAGAVPYFAMEYIPGARPITEYAAAHRLSLRERLALFSQVCDAVHHGHTKGVVHRDLKPGNILVDSAGQPKVIDFGVARATDGDLAVATLQTEAQQIIGTLQYMSPEQAGAGDARQIDARSDVYSLGIVLYELITGTLPYDLSRALIAEATRIIREQAPTPPSSIDHAAGGDAETIVLMALSKDRQRRYQTAADLKTDIDALLRGEPLPVGRRDSLGYIAATRARAWVGSHPWATLAVMVVVGVVAAQALGVHLMYRWTHLALLAERWMGETSPAAAAPPLESVRVIAIEPDTPFEELAAANGLDGKVTAGDRASRRWLHAALMRRLIGAHAKVLVWDVNFPGPHDANAEFGAAAQALQDAGTPVVVATRSWTLDHGAPARITATLRGPAAWGGTTAAEANGVVWGLDLAVQHTPVDVVPSLALAALAAARKPGAMTQIRMLPESGVVEVWYAPQASEARTAFYLPTPDWFPASAIRAVRDDEISTPEQGFQPGDVAACVALSFPPDAVLQQATVTYRAAMTAGPEELARWFGGRTVVVGDFGAGDNVTTVDHRVLHGSYTHAIAIESLERGVYMRLPVGWQTNSIMGAALVLGMGVSRAGRRWWRLAALTLLLTAAIIAVCTLAYRWGQLVVNPTMPVLAALLGLALARSRDRVTRARQLSHPRTS